MAGAAAQTPPIVFDSNRAGNQEIYAIEPHGGGLVAITSGGSGRFSRLPDWSPDCTQITFQSNRDDPENSDIYVMARDGSAVRRLTNDPAPEESPAWSPDGRHVAFASGVGEPEGVWVIDISGSARWRVTDGSGAAFQPAWSPDGRTIAYVSGSQANWDIFVVGADGSGARNLTDTPGRHEGGPAFSPAGDEILFDALEDGHWEIYVMRADGSRERRLTHNESLDARPAWSPDGTEIVFHSTRAWGTDGGVEDWSQFDLYVMRSDGSHVRRLTDSAAFDAHPDWCIGR